MNKKINLIRKDGMKIEGVLKELNLSYLDKIMNLQTIILDGIENKEIYASTDREEFKEYFNGVGKIIGCITNDDELIAMGVYAKKGLDNGNYGYDIDIKGDDLFNVGQIESTVVLDDYRGNKLQKIICQHLEEIALEQGTQIITATASPYNKFSVNTFLNLGYEIKKDKLKYGGLRRYVLVKHL